MLELKAFVQESVHALEDTQLQQLSDTLRVDLRGCDDRKDVERILTGLLCLDKDTALGTFLTWLRTRERQTPQASSLLAKKNGFATTFVPVISPRRSGSAAPQSNNEESQVKDHHLTDEIKHRLDELKLLETDFKEAERQVHNGSPTFEKLKAFLVKLTKLRAKEDEVRHFFIQQSQILTAQHTQMKEETLHTRAQLDFFVDGFTNLRRRHDELLDKSTHMKAENEVAQDVFISITAHESHFGEILHRTLLHQLEEKKVLTNELDRANSEIQQLKLKQTQLEQLISRLKQQRGDALKDASSYKQQLRKTKQKMEDMVIDGPDTSFFRQQAIQLRASLMTLIGLFRESIARDTKSAKQSMSKEILKTIQATLLSIPTQQSITSGVTKAVRVAGAADVDVGVASRQVARVVEKKVVVAKDVDQVVCGVALLGGQDGEAETCASLLSAKLKYAAVDIKKMLEHVREETVLEGQRAAQALAAAATDPGGGVAVPLTITVPPPTPLPPTIENYLAQLKTALLQHQHQQGARGLLFYNCELTAREVNLLIGEGIPVDSIIELKTPPPPPPPAPVVKQPVETPSSSKPGTRTSTATKTPASPTRGTASGSRPGAKPTTPSNSPTKSPSRQQTTDPKRATPATPSTTRSAVTASSPMKPIKPKIDRRAIFAGMPQAFAQLEPVTFVEDRVDQILDVLTRQKQRQETPFVVWDEDTSQLNESLLMYAEDLHMMLWVELENRKPKKPGQDSPTKPGTPASSSKPGGSSSPTRPGAKPTSTKAPAKAPAKGKPASPSRTTAKSSSPSKAPAKASSPAKSPAKAKPVSPPKTAAKAPVKAASSGSTSPKKPAASSTSPPKKMASSPDTKRKAA